MAPSTNKGQHHPATQVSWLRAGALTFPGLSPVAHRASVSCEKKMTPSHLEPNTVAGPRRNLTGFRYVPLVTLDPASVRDNPFGASSLLCYLVFAGFFREPRTRFRMYIPAPATIPRGKMLRKMVVARNACRFSSLESKQTGHAQRASGNADKAKKAKKVDIATRIIGKPASIEPVTRAPRNTKKPRRCRVALT